MRINGQEEPDFGLQKEIAATRLSIGIKGARIRIFDQKKAWTSENATTNARPAKRPE